MAGKHLAIQLADHSARFVVLKNDIILNGRDLVFKSTSEDQKKKELHDYFESTSFLNEDFDEVTLAWSTKKSTLVPNNIFSESDPISIFELCYGKQESNDSIDYNRISELSIINIFEIPIWIKRFFVVKFPRIVIQHEGTHVLRSVMHQDTFRAKATVVLHKNYFQLTIVKHNNLEFYSFFDYQTHEDVLYHLLFTLQQKELTSEKGFLEFVSGADADSSILSDLEDDFIKIKDIEQLQMRVPIEFISKAQLLCV